MKITTKSVVALISFVILLSSLVLNSIPKSVAQLVVCDVGQGDSLLVIKKELQVLIDGGPRGDAVLACLSRHMPFWDRKIDLVVITNTDYDHLNGLSSVLPRYEIGQIVTGDGVGESDAIGEFIDTLRETNHSVSQVGQGDIIKVAGLTFRVLWPKDPNIATLAALNPSLSTDDRSRVLGINIVKNTNERSVVLELDENGYKALLVGDIGDSTEKSLLSNQVLTDIDLLKVGHHGSKYSSSEEFLQKIRPNLAIISVGERNTYGHPTLETLSRLQAIGAAIRRTDQEGDIVVNLVK